MARRCNDCDFSTADPFVDRCPECGGFLAIASGGAARRPRPAGTDRRPVRDPDRSPNGWKSWAVAGVVAAGVGGYIVWSQSQKPGGPPAPADAPANGARIGLGTSVKDAVLAIEPEPPTDRQVTLHDLLGPNAPKSGHFTWSDGHRTIAVSFRDGKITSVSEQTFAMPDGFAVQMPTQVSISAEDDAPPPAAPDPE